MAAESEMLLDHEIGRGHGRIDIARRDLARESEVVAERRVERHRVGAQRRLGIGERRQRPPLDAIRAPASSASARVAATTAAIGSPCQRARSMASACCGADFMPFEVGLSAPTPGV